MHKLNITLTLVCLILGLLVGGSVSGLVRGGVFIDLPHFAIFYLISGALMLLSLFLPATYEGGGGGFRLLCAAVGLVVLASSLLSPHLKLSRFRYVGIFLGAFILNYPAGILITDALSA